jgi:hypothetical protein
MHQSNALWKSDGQGVEETIKDGEEAFADNIVRSTTFGDRPEDGGERTWVRGSSAERGRVEKSTTNRSDSRGRTNLIWDHNRGWKRSSRDGRSG